jgi:NADH-quinone oxidoreductase subunit M
MFFGKLNEKYTGLVDINRRELFTVVPLLVITIFLGIYPRPFLDMIKETMNVLIDQVVIVGGIAGIF